MAYILIRVRELKIAKELNDLAKVLLGPNQKSNEFGISEHKMWTEIHSRRQETFTKVLLGADIDKMRRN